LGGYFRRQRTTPAPAWIKSHDPANLPDGWTRLHHDEAIRRLRCGANDNPNGAAVHAHGSPYAPDPLPTPCQQGKVPKSAVFDGTAEGAP